MFQTFFLFFGHCYFIIPSEKRNVNRNDTVVRLTFRPSDGISKGLIPRGKPRILTSRASSGLAKSLL
ncbi:MAG: hypothetical protein BMS9Abin13_195 [Patescibacteria group bacterium]|nr:MAG: hypothetical protein BMS9Abin13_195 [Patescibacteria group bacterium]